MAPTRRRRKHRGTQAGTIEARGRTGRAQTRTEAREIARQRREERMNRPPSWSGAFQRAAITSAILAVVLVAVAQWPLAASLTLSAVMMLLYAPMGFYLDKLMYQRRQRRKAGAG